MKQNVTLWLVILLCSSLAFLPSCGRMNRSRYVNNTPMLSANDYMQLAAQTSGQKKYSYLLLAINRLLQDHRVNAAQDLLAQLDDNALTPVLQAEKQILQGQLQLFKQQPQLTLETLNRVVASNVVLPNRWQITLHRLLADAYRMQGDYLASMSQIGEVLSLLPPQAQGSDLLVTWQSLQALSAQSLQNLLQQATTPYQQGWISLAIISKQTPAVPVLLHALRDWKKQFPNHPARMLLTNLKSSQLLIPSVPQHIALLLPLQGRLAQQGKAIRNGFFAAYYQAKKQGYTPTISVNDTGQGDIEAIYQNAVRQGADFIVGPLTKRNLATLVNANAIRVPTLALNTLANHDGKITNLYQFSLSPLDEAQQAATKSYYSGHARVAVIVPAGTWGAKIAAAFQQRWQAMGGQVVAQLNYQQRTDFNSAIRHLLNIDQANHRALNLRYILQQKIRTVARRRQDIDTIFLVATPAQAREILPLLRYYYAGDIPVYATSLSYSGIPRPTVDHDLDGMIFADMPWVLAPDTQLPPDLAQIRTRIQALWATSYKRNNKLYGLGVDAYDVIPQLGKLILLPQLGLYGATGMLYLKPNQQLYRKLLWAQMVAGNPKRLAENCCLTQMAIAINNTRLFPAHR